MVRRRTSKGGGKGRGERPVDRAERRARYVPVPGSRIRAAEATDVGAVIDRLIAQGRGTPENLREEARKKSSPAHKWYIWNDQEAAEIQRLQQSRKYFRSIAVIIEDVDRPVPGFERISFLDEDGSESRRYEKIQDVKDDDALMRQALDRARSDLYVWLRRYMRYRVWSKRLGILDEVFDMLEKHFEDMFVHKSATKH